MIIFPICIVLIIRKIELVIRGRIEGSEKDSNWPALWDSNLDDHMELVRIIRNVVRNYLTNYSYFNIKVGDTIFFSDIIEENIEEKTKKDH